MKVFSTELLEDMVAIVTGGGTGLGKRMAQALGQAGASVMLVGRREDPLKATQEELTQMDIGCGYVVGNIRNPEDVQRTVSETIRVFGKVNILINNAGGQFVQAAEDFSVNGWKAVIDTNLNGTFYMTQAVGRQMIKQKKGGVVLNILVNFLHRGASGIAHSVAARNGVYGLTKTLAVEWAKYQIRVNAIGPGRFITEGMMEEMASAGGPSFVETVRQGTPLKRTGRPEELAWLATFLCSPAASYITGEYIRIDGGNSLGGGIQLLPEEF